MIRSMIVLMVLLLPGCSAPPAPDDSPTGAIDEGADLVATVEGVCAARDEALQSPAQAASVFLDRSHDGLHRLADDVASLDREIAGTLLEAKQRVELAVDAGRGGALQDSLQNLATASGEALRALGGAEPGCVSEPGQ